MFKFFFHDGFEETSPHSNHLSEVKSSKNPKLNGCEISLNPFTDRIVGAYNCFERQMSFGFADSVPLFSCIIKLAMSSNLHEDVWRHSSDSLCIVRFRCTQNGKHSKIEKA